MYLYTLYMVCSYIKKERSLCGLFKSESIDILYFPFANRFRTDLGNEKWSVSFIGVSYRTTVYSSHSLIPYALWTKPNKGKYLLQKHQMRYLLQVFQLPRKSKSSLLQFIRAKNFYLMKAINSYFSFVDFYFDALQVRLPFTPSVNIWC